MASGEIVINEVERSESGSLSVNVQHPKIGNLVIRTVEVEKIDDQDTHTELEVGFLQKPEFFVFYKNGTNQDWEWHLTNRRVVEAIVEDSELVRTGILKIGEHHTKSLIPSELVSTSFRNGRPEDVGFTS